MARVALLWAGLVCLGALGGEGLLSAPCAAGEAAPLVTPRRTTPQPGQPGQPERTPAPGASRTAGPRAGTQTVRKASQSAEEAADVALAEALKAAATLAERQALVWADWVARNNAPDKAMFAVVEGLEGETRVLRAEARGEFVLLRLPQFETLLIPAERIVTIRVKRVALPK